MQNLRISYLAKGLAVIGILASGTAQAAQSAQSAACLTPDQAQSIAVAALPDALASARKACLPHLAATSALTRSSTRISQVYQPAADKAWPGASRAFLTTVDLPLPPGSRSCFRPPAFDDRHHQHDRAGNQADRLRGGR